MIEQQWRKFDSVQDMAELIFYNWNKIINNYDIVYVLGDVYFGAGYNWIKYDTTFLNGKKIFIKGNHDHNSLTNIHSMVINWQGNQFELVHNPEEASGKYKYVIHGHIHKSGSHTDFKKLDGVKYFNANVEFNKYKPVLINEILGKFKSSSR